MEQAQETPRAKPRLRGVSHQLAFFGAVPLAVLLGLETHGVRERVSAIAFGASVVAMFGASAWYHRVTWSPRARLWMRRVDHAGIYALIAGSYTPFGLLVLHDEWRIVVLAIVWSGTAAAVVLKFCWVGAPKWLSAVIAIALGWVGVVVLPQIVSHLGVAAALLVLFGGLAYTVGGVVYARQRPDPLPAVFGYHEVFHALVIVAVALQYCAIAFYVL